jgi:endogenous inhibitor of DNA gyrase (YacG/DUF329 family)
MQQYQPKVCEACGRQWTPTTRYQAARNKTCGKACAAALISAAKMGATPHNKAPALTCPVCGKTFHRSPTKRRGDRPPTCSRQCRGVLYRDVLAAQSVVASAAPRVNKPDLRGAKNPAWKGGVTYKRPKGNYIGPRYVRCPLDLLAMARSDGYVMEHRLVMARWIGRPLLRSEVVNHINHNPRDNRPENLELYPSNGDHKRGEVGRFVSGVANRRFLTV